MKKRLASGCSVFVLLIWAGAGGRVEAGQAAHTVPTRGYEERGWLGSPPPPPQALAANV